MYSFIYYTVFLGLILLCYYLFCFIHILFSIYVRFYITMFISYYVYLQCR